MLGMTCCDRIVQLILCRPFRPLMSLAIPRWASDDFCRCSRTPLICPVLAADCQIHPYRWRSYVLPPSDYGSCFMTSVPDAMQGPNGSSMLRLGLWNWNPRCHAVHRGLQAMGLEPKLLLHSYADDYCEGQPAGRVTSPCGRCLATRAITYESPPCRSQVLPVESAELASRRARLEAAYATVQYLLR